MSGRARLHAEDNKPAWMTEQNGRDGPPRVRYSEHRDPRRVRSRSRERGPQRGAYHRHDRNGDQRRDDERGYGRPRGDRREHGGGFRGERGQPSPAQLAAACRAREAKPIPYLWERSPSPPRRIPGLDEPEQAADSGSDGHPRSHRSRRHKSSHSRRRRSRSRSAGRARSRRHRRSSRSKRSRTPPRRRRSTSRRSGHSRRKRDASPHSRSSRSQSAASRRSAASGAGEVPQGPALPPPSATHDGSSSEDDGGMIGPAIPAKFAEEMPAAAAAAGRFNKLAAYGQALQPGEGAAIAAYVQAGKRVPRRGEIDWKGEQIEELENQGYVMSGSRHKRINAVRQRKENQVYTAEQRREMMHQHFDEQKQKEDELVAGYQSAVRGVLGDLAS